MMSHPKIFDVPSCLPSLGLIVVRHNSNPRYLTRDYHVRTEA